MGDIKKKDNLIEKIKTITKEKNDNQDNNYDDFFDDFFYEE